jgi:hypothetical protein
VRTPFVVIALLIAVLVPVGFATSKDPPGAGASVPVATIARRVETLRGLRYRRPPKPQSVTPQQATRDGLADLDAGYPPAARHADEALYERLGLLPPHTDLRAVGGSVFGSQVAGYYDPRSKRLKIVTGTATANRVLNEMVIAHELDHALEDQAIGLDEDLASASDDRGYAYKALVEGTATFLMYDYLTRYFRRDVALGGLLGGSFSGTGGTGSLPPFVLAGLLFPYESGNAFVQTLYQRGGSTWTLVNLAERTRIPTSTEQIMHPEKWIEAERALPVGVPSPGAGWHRLTAGTFGEWQTGQLLALSGRAWANAAAGWGGDRYALYRREGADVVVLRWRFDTPGDTGEFLPILKAAVAEMPQPSAVAERDGRVTLVLAPDKALAKRLSTA